MAMPQRRLAGGIRAIDTPAEVLVAICGKCGRKLGGGFGGDGDKSLAKALRRVLPDARGKRARLRIVETRCLDICPKGAVALTSSARPGEIDIIPAGADAMMVATTLGFAAYLPKL